MNNIGMFYQAKEDAEMQEPDSNHLSNLNGRMVSC
jgi:hypothetical protein